jgi:LuxR family transcriptional regulator, maltose regulon positive regulatory protein
VGDAQIPRPAVHVLDRPRLTAAIEDAAARRVTLITGPPGAGKTVACAAWAMAAARTRRVAWLTLDRRDADPARFLASLAAALGGPAAKDLASLAAGLARAARGPAVIVLDDVQELAGGEVLADLDFLVHHAPRELRLVISGRWVPGLQVAKMRVAGEVAEIGASDLACTPGEAAGYFAALGIELGEQERAMLFRRTEGWMAALRLAALTQAGGLGAEPGGLGAEPLVADYVRDELLSRQPAEVRMFLLRTSVARSLTGELAGALAGTPDGDRILDQLERENCCTTRLADGSGRYRYHPLLREVLLAELRRSLPGEVSGLLRHAAGWHADRGELTEALWCRADAGDWDGAARALARGALDAVLSGEADGVEPLLSRFPGTDPMVSLGLAAARLRAGDLEAADAFLDRAGQAADRTAVLWLAALTVIRGLPGAIAEGWRRAEAPGDDRHEPRALAALWAALGVALLRGGCYARAIAALEAADRHLAAAGQAETGPDGGPRGRVLAWRALAEAMYGDLGGAGRTLAQVTAPGWDVAPGRIAGLGRITTIANAQLALDRDDLAEAARLADMAAPAGDRAAGGDGAAAGDPGAEYPGEPRVELLATMIRARIALAAGDIPRAGAHAAAARELAGDADLNAVASLDADIALRSGDTAAAAAAVAAIPRQGRAVPRAGLLLARGDPAAAVREASRGLDDATPRDRITALLTSAVASRRLGETETAARHIEEALAIAAPQEACRPFLDAGTAVHSAIATLVPPTSPGAGFAARVLERFVVQQASASAPAQAVRLTPSELAVLRFLPSYLTNQEIAEALFLSVNTVKTHLKSAYHKLGVSSRREAVARARHLQLL